MLAVVGGKGGVGKTTVALALGAALGRAGWPAVVVDCDAEMPDCATRTGVSPTPGVDALAGETPLPRVLTRPECLDGAALVPARAGAPVGAALERLPADRPTVLDAPGGAGPPAATALRAADRSLVVTTPSRPAVEDAVKTATLARSLGAPPVGAVVTMAEETPPGLSEALETPVLARLGPVGDTPLEASVTRRTCGGLAGRLRGKC